ncbi:uncharacterized protein FIBRA_00574 [Fibroporia radiculosa]|uniref:Uncharacterized protein n=1 Tax=Fibroporia radiculosa TaxID=599839 RepID=J4G0F6_9APHY|nr:uncharacterized protein FIBRA_00574 [Fibroporia radiculosa]CCL98573.1 predicted protein [Fibroporia radiculosa]
MRAVIVLVMSWSPAERIKAGAKVILSDCCSSAESYEKRREDLWTHAILICDCWLCKDDRADGESALRRRDQLTDEFFRDAVCDYINMKMSKGSPEERDHAKKELLKALKALGMGTAGVVPSSEGTSSSQQQNINRPIETDRGADAFYHHAAFGL